MNPVSDELLSLLRQGKNVYKICVDPNMKPDKTVVFHVEGGSKKLPTKGDHNAFLKWWGETASLIRRMRKIEELNEKLV
jgi:hypothetical protein